MNHLQVPKPFRWAGLALAATVLPLTATSLIPGGNHPLEVIAHWRFQSGVKGQAAGPHHVITDSSGQDRHGLAIGGPRFRGVELPASNLALAFGGADDRIFVPDDEIFQLTRSRCPSADFSTSRAP